MDYSDIIEFHGHECPGLAIGYRMACAGMAALDSIRSEDEEVIAIVENDACGADALQCVTGCTFGKGNLFFHDHGKQVYTLYSRTTRKGVRIVFHRKGAPEGISEDRAAFAKWILSAPEESIITITEVIISEPEPARIMKSQPCSLCGEQVMESRLEWVNGNPLCIPCSAKKKNG
ncbi:MAG: TraR/DksA C4-type zinc finger protein [Desulfobulbaceae bacterium]|nr:TraR/DksA C4-type zinc finger protein [Desulfobulbaceae bacterium]